MLKNHLGVVLPRFPEKSSDPYAACKQRDHGRWFGNREDPYIYNGGNPGRAAGLDFDAMNLMVD
jgi:hypothetical protein